ncbi:MAG TPA: hypothetical protein VGF74_14715 [Thermoleophilaceae bacterium]
MAHVLQHRPAWFLIGPLVGLVVVALFATINERIGVLGGYSAFLERGTQRSARLGWKAWFLVGVLGGGLGYRLLAGRSTVAHGYGWLTRAFPHAGMVTAGLLLLAGALIGFGAKTAGGCTSGNGIGGCSAGSPASFAATATFMGTAVVASFVLRAIT